MNPFSRIDEDLPKIGMIATAGYFLGLRIRGAAPLMAFHTYPAAWQEEYTTSGYMLRDPITTWAMTIGGTIRWDSPLLPDPFGIFRKARAHGLRFGASIAHGPLGSLSICSAARSDRNFTDAEIAAMKEIVIGLHDAVELPRSLDPQQKTLLAALAEGRRGADLATTLGVPAAAAARSVNDLCTALIARSPEEAVQRARDYKLL